MPYAGFVGILLSRKFNYIKISFVINSSNKPTVHHIQWECMSPQLVCTMNNVKYIQISKYDTTAQLSIVLFKVSSTGYTLARLNYSVSYVNEAQCIYCYHRVPTKVLDTSTVRDIQRMTGGRVQLQNRVECLRQSTGVAVMTIMASLFPNTGKSSS